MLICADTVVWCGWVGVVWCGVVRCGVVYVLFTVFHCVVAITCRVRSKDYKKRALQRIPFTLGEGVQLGVGV